MECEATEYTECVNGHDYVGLSITRAPRFPTSRFEKSHCSIARRPYHSQGVGEGLCIVVCARARHKLRLRRGHARAQGPGGACVEIPRVIIIACRCGGGGNREVASEAHEASATVFTAAEVDCRSVHRVTRCFHPADQGHLQLCIVPWCYAARGPHRKGRWTHLARPPV